MREGNAATWEDASGDKSSSDQRHYAHVKMETRVS